MKIGDRVYRNGYCGTVELMCADSDDVRVLWNDKDWGWYSGKELATMSTISAPHPMKPLWYVGDVVYMSGSHGIVTHYDQNTGDTKVAWDTGTVATHKGTSLTAGTVAYYVGGGGFGGTHISGPTGPTGAPAPVPNPQRPLDVQCASCGARGRTANGYALRTTDAFWCQPCVIGGYPILLNIGARLFSMAALNQFMVDNPGCFIPLSKDMADKVGKVKCSTPVSKPVICRRCNAKNDFANPNQADGSYLCFECRT